MRPKIQRKVHGKKSEAGVAYVYLPEGVDREIYIRDAMRKSSLSLINDFSERIDNVRVAKHILNEIEFPQNRDELGSMIVWVNIPRNNQPIAVGVVPKGNEVAEILEGEFSFKRVINGTSISISGNANNGSLTLDVFSKDKSPKIFFNASTPNNDAEVIMKVSGSAKIFAEDGVEVQAAKKILSRIVNEEEDAEKFTEISYELGTGFSYVDEFGNKILANEERVLVEAAKTVILGSGKEPVVLGDTLTSLLEELIEAIISIKTATSIGAQPILNIPQFQSISKKLDTIKSEYSKTQ